MRTKPSEGETPRDPNNTSAAPLLNCSGQAFAAPPFTVTLTVEQLDLLRLCRIGPERYAVGLLGDDRQTVRTGSEQGSDPVCVISRGRFAFDLE